MTSHSHGPDEGRLITFTIWLLGGIVIVSGTCSLLHFFGIITLDQRILWLMVAGPITIIYRIAFRLFKSIFPINNPQK
jgi:hypothetical protein